MSGLCGYSVPSWDTNDPRFTASMTAEPCVFCFEDCIFFQCYILVQSVISLWNERYRKWQDWLLISYWAMTARMRIKCFDSDNSEILLGVKVTLEEQTFTLYVSWMFLSRLIWAKHNRQETLSLLSWVAEVSPNLSMKLWSLSLRSAMPLPSLMPLTSLWQRQQSADEMGKT